jgi:non-specific serine/threonine protein kinase
MSEEAASFAVLGVDIETLGAAVARHWGLDESVLHMIRRCSPDAPVRALESDDDMLRATASCANEVVDALAMDARHAAQALQHVAQRYARALELSLRDLQLAAQGQSPQVRDPAPDVAVPPGTRHAA